MATQVAGYTVFQSSKLNFDVDEAVGRAQRSSELLTEMLQMLEPHEIGSNEIAKLWSAFEMEKIDALQASLESLNTACSKYEMMKDIAEGEWEFVSI
ncbi:hypothetical protein VTP01DRAFT_6904 [Rhizomucor pusillus]|uniref:uncharacterized protein n=1 Tax=Rhizomucor pusillus TaxID=4840 RepID=UPI003742F48E